MMNGPVLAWQLSHHWFVASKIVEIIAVSQPVESGVTERQKERGWEGGVTSVDIKGKT